MIMHYEYKKVTSHDHFSTQTCIVLSVPQMAGQIGIKSSAISWRNTEQIEY